MNAVAQANARHYVLTGPAPALRTLFYRLARLASLPVALVVVFDGPLRPGVKRNTRVVKKEYYLAKDLRAFVRAFGFHEHTVSHRLQLPMTSTA